MTVEDDELKHDQDAETSNDLVAAHEGETARTNTGDHRQ